MLKGVTSDASIGGRRCAGREIALVGCMRVAVDSRHTGASIVSCILQAVNRLRRKAPSSSSNRKPPNRTLDT